MARPSGCTKEVLEKAKSYVSGGYEDLDHVLPSASGLALHLGVTRMTLYNWKEQETNEYAEEFSDLMDQLQATQEVKAISGGLTGKFNPALTMRILTNHGYGEKQSLEHSGSGGGPMEHSVEITFNPVGRGK